MTKNVQNTLYYNSKKVHTVKFIISRAIIDSTEFHFNTRLEIPLAYNIEPGRAGEIILSTVAEIEIQF